MPGLPYENLPAQQDPMGILENQYNRTMQYNRSQYDTELNTLKQSMLSDKDFYDKLNDLNMRHQQVVNKQNHEADMKLQEVKRVQSLIDSRQIAPDAGQEAIWRLVLPSETERAMFQAAGRQGRQPLSIAQLFSDAMQDSIEDFADAAPGKPRWKIGPPTKFKEGLVQQYLGWRRLQGYDDPTMTPIIQRQLDDQWDAYMLEDKFSTWWSNKERRKPITEVSALRATGKIGRAMRDRVTGVGMTTPLGQSIVTKRKVSPYSMETRRGISMGREPERVQVPDTGLPRPGNDPQKYAAIPSGGRYIRTDGQIGTKR